MTNEYAKAFDEIGKKLNHCVSGRTSNPEDFADSIIQFMGWFNARSEEIRGDAVIVSEKTIDNSDKIDMLDESIKAWNDIYEQRKDCGKQVADMLIDCLTEYHDWVTDRREELLNEYY